MRVEVKIELTVKIKTQVAQDGFRGNDGASYRREIDRRVGGISSSCEVEEFGLAVFHDKTGVEEDFRHDIVTTE